MLESYVVYSADLLTANTLYRLSHCGYEGVNAVMTGTYLKE